MHPAGENEKGGEGKYPCSPEKILKKTIPSVFSTAEFGTARSVHTRQRQANTTRFLCSKVSCVFALQHAIPASLRLRATHIQLSQIHQAAHAHPLS
jgi:hypothetical protein